MSNSRRIFYGWWIVAASFGILFINTGIGFYSFGVFIKPLMAEFGWSMTQVSLAWALVAITACIFGFIVAKLVNRYKLNYVILAGALVGSAVLFLLSQTASLWHFYSLYIVLAISLGVAAGPIPIFTAISRWFNNKRGRAMGFATAGTAIGALAIVPSLGYIIENSSWQSGYMFLGVLALVVDVPLTLFILKDKPGDMGLVPDGDDSTTIKDTPHRIHDTKSEVETGAIGSLTTYLKSPALWLLGFGLLFASIGEMGIVIHEVPHLMDIGIPATIAAGALGFTGGIGGLGKLALGYWTERLSVRYVFIICFTLQAIAVVILIYTNNMVMVWAFVIIFGFAFGGIFTLIPLTIGARFPLPAFSMLYSFVNCMFLIGTLVGPLVAGIVYDATGNYTNAFWGFIGAYAIAILAIYFTWGSNYRPFHGTGTKGTVQ